LALDLVPAFERTDAITAYWRKILEIYVAATCDSFSLSGIRSAEAIQRIACFSDWQPPLKDRVAVRVEWDTPASGRRRRDDELTRFGIDVEVIARLMEPQFHDWFVSSDVYPADRLCFFSSSQLILEAEPHDLSMLFYRLTPGQRELLWSIDPTVFQALDFSRNWVATPLRLPVATS